VPVLTGVPKELKVGKEVVALKAWDPAVTPGAFLDKLQDVTIYLGPPLWIMSPRMRIYKAEQVVRRKGYLKSFVPSGFTETEEPTAEFTVTFTPEILKEF
jgi:hypothetical protein